VEEVSRNFNHQQALELAISTNEINLSQYFPLLYSELKIFLLYICSRAKQVFKYSQTSLYMYTPSFSWGDMWQAEGKQLRDFLPSFYSSGS
jgi:hypothetical protein